MFDKVASRVADNLVENSIVDADDKEIYHFGIQQGLTTLLGMGSFITIGWVFGVFWQMTIFIVAFIPLRSFAGGYHASTPKKCFMLSIILAVGVALLIVHVSVYGQTVSTIAIIAALIIMAFVPVEDRNKPLDHKEREHYQVIARAISASFAVLAVCLTLLQFYVVAVSVAWAVAAAAVMVVIGKVKNNLLDR